MKVTLILLLSVVLMSCSGTSLPEDCEIRHDGVCYRDKASACAAADCPKEHCTILRSYPGKVSCGQLP